MCGRMVLTLPHEAMVNLFGATPGNDLPEVPDYNICPTDRVHVVSAQDGVRRLGAMRWGFLPHWYKAMNGGPLLINARGETIAEKPAFRAAVRLRRCIVPASGFYEWTKDEAGNRLPWYITRADGSPMAMAAVWQGWGEDDPVNTCAVVTTGANAAMSAIHHRMPVILEPEDWALWLGEAGHGAAPLMTAPPDEALTWHRVDPAVNSNRAEGPELIEPLEEAGI
ncbi:SOS response-associated peptidase [Oceaniglobus trochenteri]|uniref:SOS response-associated peptidase n=1 Tax=Oceaniglobus trochenteri TaxID=2763260 RepID=UPI001CFFE76C|nr:SOS response-associated peptidase [Oceaniglobus trochenteri]